MDKSYAHDKIAQTYIFSGADSLGKSLVAQCLAGRLILADFKADVLHPELDLEKLISSGDCHIVERLEGKKNISVDQIRDFINILGMGAFAGNRKVGIIKAAETLSLEAANSLLKLLEEPKSGVVLILLTSSLDNILPTILSRSQVLNFFPVETKLIRDFLQNNLGATLALANDLAALSGGRPGRAIEFFRDKEFYEAYLRQAQVFINFLQSDLAERLKDVASLFDGEEAVTKAKQIIDIWELVARDLVLLSLNNNDLVTLHNFLPELKNLVLKLELNRINSFFPVFKKAKTYLAANVTPKNVLEYIAINI